MTDWAVQLPKSQSHYVPRLRGRAGVFVHAPDGIEFVWLKGTLSEGIESQLGALPGQRYEVLDDGQLLPSGKRVPSGYLPDGEWFAVEHWVGLTLPAPRISTGRFKPCALSLERSDAAPVESNALLTDTAAWSSYVDTAPAIRLEPLRFAAAVDGRGLVLGNPLPPLPGEHLVVTNDIAVPAGLRWVPAVAPSIARRVFGGGELAEGSIVLWLQSEHWEVVEPDSILAATRAGVRLTLGRESLP